MCTASEYEGRRDRTRHYQPRIIWAGQRSAEGGTMKHVRIRNPRRGIASLAIALAAAGAGIGIANPASAAVRGLDLQVSGCNYQAPGTTIVLRANNVYGWK